MKKIFLLLVIGLLASQLVAQDEFVKGSLKVKLKRLKDTTLVREQLGQLFVKNNVTAFYKSYPVVKTIKAPDKDGVGRWFTIYGENCDESTLMAGLEGSKLFEYVEKLPIDIALFVPNDYYLLNNTPGAGPDLAGDFIHAKQAWTYSKGSPSIKVGIIDANLQRYESNMWNHEDIKGKISYWDTGYWGYQYRVFHGLFVTGIVAGITNNGKGKASIGYNTGLMFSSRINGDSAMLLFSGLGAKVLSFSRGHFTYSQAEQDVINLVTANGTLVVAAVGNLPYQGGYEYAFYPASCDNVLSVTGISCDYHFVQPNGEHFNYFSSVGVCAPGYNVLSLFDSCLTCYKTSGGTSFACPLVSGTAALIFALNPNATPAQVMDIIKLTANDTIYDIPENLPYLGKLGTGALNAGAALKYASDLFHTYIAVPYSKGETHIMTKPATNHLTITPDSVNFDDGDMRTINIINTTTSPVTLTYVQQYSNGTQGWWWEVSNMTGSLPYILYPLDTFKVVVSFWISIKAVYLESDMQIISSIDTQIVRIYLNEDFIQSIDNRATEKGMWFPNPSTGKFWYNGDQTPEKTEIYTTMGELLEITTTKFIDLSDFPNGIYVFKAYLRKQVKVSRVIINK